MKLEKDLQQSIQKRLSVYQMTGECEWWIRLNSFHIRTVFGSYIKGCPKGTPDFLALIRNRNNGITVLFIELKSDTGRLSKEQVEFHNIYSRIDGFVILTIREVIELDQWIYRNAINKVEELPSTLETIK